MSVHLSSFIIVQLLILLISHTKQESNSYSNFQLSQNQWNDPLKQIRLHGNEQKIIHNSNRKFDLQPNLYDKQTEKDQKDKYFSFLQKNTHYHKTVYNKKKKILNCKNIKTNKEIYRNFFQWENLKLKPTLSQTSSHAQVNQVLEQNQINKADQEAQINYPLRMAQINETGGEAQINDFFGQVKVNSMTRQISVDSDTNNKKLMPVNRKLQTFTVVEFIRNGNFTVTDCKWLYCVWNTTNFKPQNLLYWQPAPQLQIGYGSIYSAGASNNYVVEIVANRPSCFQQQIQNLPSGQYQLKYIYSVQFSVSLLKAQIYVYLNTTKIDDRSALNHAWNTAIVTNIVINNSHQTYYLKFCGNNSLHDHGVLISSVSFSKIAQIPVSITNSTNDTSTILPSNTIADNSNTTNPINSTDNVSNTNTNNNITNTTGLTDTTQNTSDSSSPGGGFNTTQYQSPVLNQNLNNNFLLNMSNSNISNLGNLNSIQNLMNSNLTFNFSSNFLLQMNQRQFMQYLMGFVALSISNPVVGQIFKSSIIRKVFSKGFSFLANFDHLWLYIYQKKHDQTQYDSILRWVDYMQRSKWNFLPFDIQNQIFAFQTIEEQLSYRQKYTPDTFTVIQNISRDFLLINYKYFIVNIPVVLAVFFLCRLIHYLFCRFKIYYVFRDFRLKSFLILILLEGNCEHFTYFLLSDFLNFFSKEPCMKSINILSVCFFFTIVFILIAVPFILRYLYESGDSVEFYDKCRNSLKGTVFFMIQFGLFNFLLGSIHILCQSDTNFQSIMLLCVELVFLLYISSSFQPRKQIFTSMITIWIMAWASFVRIILIFSEYFYDSSEVQVAFQFDKVQEECIVLYFFLLILSLAHLVVNIFLSIAQLINKLCFKNNKVVKILKQEKFKKKMEKENYENNNQMERNKLGSTEVAKTRILDNEKNAISG